MISTVSSCFNRIAVPTIPRRTTIIQIMLVRIIFSAFCSPELSPPPASPPPRRFPFRQSQDRPPQDHRHRLRIHLRRNRDHNLRRRGLGLRDRRQLRQFHLDVTVAKSAQPGTHNVQATGLASGISASTNFLVRTNWPSFKNSPRVPASTLSKTRSIKTTQSASRWPGKASWATSSISPRPPSSMASSTSARSTANCTPSKPTVAALNPSASRCGAAPPATTSPLRRPSPTVSSTSDPPTTSSMHFPRRVAANRPAAPLWTGSHRQRHPREFSAGRERRRLHRIIRQEVLRLRGIRLRKLNL